MRCALIGSGSAGNAFLLSTGTTTVLVTHDLAVARLKALERERRVDLLARVGVAHHELLEAHHRVEVGRVVEADAPFAERLLCLFEGITEVIALYAPQEAAIEETFMTANGQSTLKLGHARAAAMIAPARAGLSVAEYAAKVVKKAVVGTGGADKDQVAWMIARLLPTAGSPTADAADALAVAIAHAHARKSRMLAA